MSYNEANRRLRLEQDGIEAAIRKGPSKRRLTKLENRVRRIEDEAIRTNQKWFYKCGSQLMRRYSVPQRLTDEVHSEVLLGAIEAWRDWNPDRCNYSYQVWNKAANNVRKLVQNNSAWSKAGEPTRFAAVAFKIRDELGDQFTMDALLEQLHEHFTSRTFKAEDIEKHMARLANGGALSLDALEPFQAPSQTEPMFDYFESVDVVMRWMDLLREQHPDDQEVELGIEVAILYHGFLTGLPTTWDDVADRLGDGSKDQVARAYRTVTEQLRELMLDHLDG